MLRPIGILAVIVIGCAQPTTHRPTVSLPELSQEITFQAREEFRQEMELAERVRRIADSVLRAGSAFCGENDRRTGFYYTDKSLWAKLNAIDRNIYLDYYGLSEDEKYPYVTDVSPGSAADRAGLKRGDRIVRFNNHRVDPIRKKVKERYIGRTGAVQNVKIVEKWVRTLANAAEDAPRYKPFPVEVLRRHAITQLKVERELLERSEVTHKDTTFILQMERDTICKNQVFPVNGRSVNAYTDGKNIGITKGMASFASDEELALVIAHELAHCTEKHIRKKKTNAILGGFLGGLADGIMGGLGIPTYGDIGVAAARAGSQAFSQSPKYTTVM